MLCYLGVTRQEFAKLCKVKRHAAILSAAMSRIEAFTEENALCGVLSCNASLNSLKYNFGWGEKHEQDDEMCDGITVTLSPEITALAK